MKVICSHKIHHISADSFDKFTILSIKYLKNISYAGFTLGRHAGCMQAACVPA